MTSLACPSCGAEHVYYLIRDDDTLRRCPECDRWFLVCDTGPGSGGAYRLVGLENPPTCPVDGCGATVRDNRLDVHVIERHDGDLSPDP